MLVKVDIRIHKITAMEENLNKTFSRFRGQLRYFTQLRFQRHHTTDFFLPLDWMYIFPPLTFPCNCSLHFALSLSLTDTH